jgi:hypothetical protein
MSAVDKVPTLCTDAANDVLRVINICQVYHNSIA